VWAKSGGGPSPVLAPSVMSLVEMEARPHTDIREERIMFVKIDDQTTDETAVRHATPSEAQNLVFKGKYLSSQERTGLSKGSFEGRRVTFWPDPTKVGEAHRPE